MAISREKWDKIAGALDSLRVDIDAQSPTLTVKDAQDRLTNILLGLNEAGLNSLYPDLAAVRFKAWQLRQSLGPRPASGGRRTKKMRRRSKKTRRTPRG